MRFWIFWQLSLWGNLVLIVAQDAISFYLGFSVMSLSAYGLIVHNKGPQPRRAGRVADLLPGVSGLADISARLEAVEDIAVVRLAERDIVRHPLVASMIGVL